MVDQDAIISDFMGLLADLRSSFRRAHIGAERVSRFATVDTTMGSSRIELADESGIRVPSVEVSISVDAELREQIGDRYSLGVFLAVRYANGEWTTEAEVGWSCVQSGWDNIDSWVQVESSFVELESQIASIADGAIKRFMELL